MSFSSETKDALARVPSDHAECALAELVAVLCISGTVSLLGGGRMGMHVVTEHAPTARRLIRLMRQRFDVQPELRASRQGRLGGRNSYSLSVAGEEAVTVLTACGVLRRDGEGRFSLRPAIPKEALAKTCCRRAFLRGAFLAGGSLSNPDKEYHLEFVAGDPRFGTALLALLAKFALSAKMVRRKEAVVESA